MDFLQSGQWTFSTDSDNDDVSSPFVTSLLKWQNDYQMFGTDGNGTDPRKDEAATVRRSADDECDAPTLKEEVSRKIYSLVDAACKRQEEVWGRGKDIVDMDLQEIVLLELDCPQDTKSSDVVEKVSSQESVRKSLRRAKRRRRRRRKNQLRNSEDLGLPLSESESSANWDVQLALASLRLRYTDSMIALKRLEYRQANVGILASAVHNEWMKTYGHLMSLHVYMSCLGSKKLKHLLQDIPGIRVIGVGGSTRFTTDQHYRKCCRFTCLPEVSPSRQSVSSEDTSQSVCTQISSPTISTPPTPPCTLARVFGGESSEKSAGAGAAPATVLIESLGRILARGIAMRCKAQYALARKLSKPGPLQASFALCAMIETALKAKEMESVEWRASSSSATASAWMRMMRNNTRSVDGRSPSLIEASLVSAAFARRNGILGVPLSDLSRVFFQMTKFPLEPLLLPLSNFGDPLEFIYSIPGIFIDYVPNNGDEIWDGATGHKTFLFSSDIIWKVITDPCELLEEQQA